MWDYWKKEVEKARKWIDVLFTQTRRLRSIRLEMIRSIASTWRGRRERRRRFSLRFCTERERESIGRRRLNKCICVLVSVCLCVLKCIYNAFDHNHNQNNCTNVEKEAKNSKRIKKSMWTRKKSTRRLSRQQQKTIEV